MSRFYYDLNRSITTNGSTLTESQHYRALTVANKRRAVLSLLSAKARGSTAGGAGLRVKTAGTPGSGGTAQTPAQRDGTGPAAGLTAFNDATPLVAGSTLTVRLGVGFAQTGGQGAWVALEPDAGLGLEPNGGATGNMEIYSIAVGTSIPADLDWEFFE